MTGHEPHPIGTHADLRLEAADAWARLVADKRHLRTVTNDVEVRSVHTTSRSGPTVSVLRQVLRRAGDAFDQVVSSSDRIDLASRGALFVAALAALAGVAVPVLRHRISNASRLGRSP